MEKEPPSPLEWDFSALDDYKLRIAFFYEYSRDSLYVKNTVSSLRSVGGWKNAPEPIFIDEETQLDHDLIRRMWTIEQIEQSPFGLAVSRLSDLEPSFPETPFAMLCSEAITRLSDRFDAWAFMPDVKLDSFINWAGRKNSFDPERREFHHQIFWGFLDRPRDEDSLRNESHHLLCLGVPKSADLETVIEVVTTELRAALSEHYAASMKAPKTNLGLGGRKLPFSCRSALEWLGVLRRYSYAGSSWEKYAELYGFSGDIVDFKRAALVKANKAREILKWFDAGGLGMVVKAKNLLRWVPDQKVDD